MAPADVLIEGLQLFHPDGARETPTSGFYEVVRSDSCEVRLQKKEGPQSTRSRARSEVRSTLHLKY